ncbi:MAG TPA: type I-B CRISPR-associated endonuclease Cas1 [Candidatus Altiarchaeales archaeon]|nr:type I-B CRISPR-associated endonuclease Cas1 [Candidatus Altiarchaeales archaeon]
MGEIVYFLNEGVMYRKKSTLFFQNFEGKRAIPINSISEIICCNRITMRSGCLSYLMKKYIPIHFFNMYGWYLGSLYPREFLISGRVVVKQAEHYLDNEKRLKIAREIVEGTKHNLLKTLEYYKRRGKEIETGIIEGINMDICTNIPELMSMEGRIWNHYYELSDKILRKFKLGRRERQPPTNEINSLISFGNCMLYTKCLTEIYHTYLNPAISFLHEPSDRRFSLALDIAEIFKPIFVSRTIFYLVNKRKIDRDCFDRVNKGVLLNEKGKRIFIEEFDKKLGTTIFYPQLKRKVSYSRLIRLECYKLMKHILEDKEYKSFRMWW